MGQSLSRVWVLVLALVLAAGPALAQSAVVPKKPSVELVPDVGGGELYEDLPGVDMTLLSAAEAKKVIARANVEKCTCGCNDDSIAWCLHHHTGCDFALPLSKLIAADESPVYRKSLTDVELANYESYRHPTENMKNQFDYLKGFDLDELSADQRARLLLKANAIACPCGCVDDTLAKCVNTDPQCAVAPQKIRELIEEIKQTGVGVLDPR